MFRTVTSPVIGTKYYFFNIKLSVLVKKYIKDTICDSRKMVRLLVVFMLYNISFLVFPV